MLKLLLLLFSIYALNALKVRKPYTCTFPFMYKGKEYDECIKFDSAAYWCSVYEVYNGTFSYCSVNEYVTDDHFMKLLKRVESNAARLGNISISDKGRQGTCESCIDDLSYESKTIDDLIDMLLDQNKRINGLKSDHKALNAVVSQIKEFYQLRHCRQTEQGAEYLGGLSKTVNGETCQSWSLQKPHGHTMTDDDAYSDGSTSLAENHCRNPDASEQPWCYTTNPSKRWTYCHVPKCNVDCRTDENLKSHLPMCDNFPSVVCPHGSSFYNNRCYKKFTTPTDFHSAENICQKYNGHLSSVHSQAENEFISKTLKPLSKYSFFIGLNDIDREGQWNNTDGTAYNYRRFYSGEPNNRYNEDCVESGRYPAQKEAWNDIDCKSKREFVCKFTL